MIDNSCIGGCNGDCYVCCTLSSKWLSGCLLRFGGIQLSIYVRNPELILTIIRTHSWSGFNVNKLILQQLLTATVTVLARELKYKYVKSTILRRLKIANPKPSQSHNPHISILWSKNKVTYRYSRTVLLASYTSE